MALPAVLQGAEPAPAAPKGLAVATLSRPTAVDFEKEILPILRGSCLACHNRTKAKADLILETPADILKGGESGAAVVPGKSGESLLFKLSAHRDKPVMPPRDNKVEAADMTADQLALLKLWIDQGAKGDVKGDQSVAWQPLPDRLGAILSLAVTADGQIAACGRANQIALYHLPTLRLIEKLTDPSLLKEGLYTNPGVAHRDMVHALAFSPDGERLASGDFRTVKLWRRQVQEKRTELKWPGLAAASALAASHDAAWFATGHADGKVALWKSSALLVHTQWVAHSGGIRQIGFSPDGGHLSSISGSSRIGIWFLTEDLPPVYILTPAEVLATAWSQDGRRIVSAGADQVLRVWNTPTNGQTEGLLLKEWKAPDARITAVATHPGSATRIITGSTSGSIRVWNLDKGEAERTVELGAAVAALAVSPDGARIAACGSNAVARVWQVSDGKVLAELSGDSALEAVALQAERDVNFSKGEVGYRQGVLDEARKREKAEADFAAKAGEARVAAEKALTEKQKAMLAAVEARLAAEKLPAELDAEQAKVVAERDAAETPAREAEAEVSAATQRVEQARAAADKAGKAAVQLAAVVTADGGKTPALAESKAAAESLAAIATKLAEDGKRVAERFTRDAAPKRKAADEAKAAADKKLADIAERRRKAPEGLTAAVKAVEKAEQEAETSLAARKSSESQLLANQAVARKAAEAVPVAVKAMEDSKKVQQQFETALQSARSKASEARRPGVSLAFSRDGEVLFVGDSLGALRSWGVGTGRGIQTWIQPAGPLASLAIGEKSDVACLGTNGIPVVLRHSESWGLEATLGALDGTSPIQGRVNALQFSPDGRMLATGSGEPSRSGELMLWDMATLKVARSFTNAHSDVVLAVDFSADGTRLASSASDRFVKVWEIASGRMERSFEGHTHHVLGVSWRRDGRTLASSGSDKVIKLWNFVTGEQKRTVGGGDKEVTSIRWVDATGEMLVSSGDSQVRLMAEDGKTVRTFGGSADFVHASTITQDGRWVVGGGQDGVLRYWNGQSGGLIKAFGP